MMKITAVDLKKLDFYKSEHKRVKKLFNNTMNYINSLKEKFYEKIDEKEYDTAKIIQIRMETQVKNLELLYEEMEELRNLISQFYEK